MEGLLQNDGFAKLKDFGFVRDTLNDKYNGWGYTAGTTEGDSGIAGVFFSFSYEKTSVQIQTSLDKKTVMVRSSNFEGAWTSWAKISIE